jgi:hypothetical protein
MAPVRSPSTTGSASFDGSIDASIITWEDPSG